MSKERFVRIESRWGRPAYQNQLCKEKWVGFFDMEKRRTYKTVVTVSDMEALENKNYSAIRSILAVKLEFARNLRDKEIEQCR